MLLKDLVTYLPLLIVIIQFVVFITWVKFTVKNQGDTILSNKNTLKSLREELEKHKDNINARLAQGATNFALINAALLEIDKKLDKIDNKLEKMENRFRNDK